MEKEKEEEIQMIKNFLSLPPLFTPEQEERIKELARQTATNSMEEMLNALPYLLKKPTSHDRDG